MREAEEIMSRGTDTSQLKNLTDIELETHRRIREYVAPELMSFLLPRVASEEESEAHPTRQHCRRLQTTLGPLRLSSGQAGMLGVEKHAQFSSLVEQFAVVVTAKVSFAQAEKDLELLCGIVISDSTLQRLVQRISIPTAESEPGRAARRPHKPRSDRKVEYLSPEGLPAPRKRGRKAARYRRVNTSPQPMVMDSGGYELHSGPPKVHHLSVDGGKVRLASRTSESGTEWRDYKGLSVNGGLPDQELHACLHDNESLSHRVRGRPGLEDATFIGDGHSGVWNAMALMRPPHFDSAAAKARGVTLEILDWYHLKENVHKVKWSKARKDRICDLLWQGKVSEAQVKGVRNPNCNLWKYLDDHRHRIVDYKARQEAGLIIGSGAVESTVKQIDARMQLPGAWWNPENVNSMLNVRTAYLNGWLHGPN